MIELLHEPLSLERCIEVVRRPGSGGLVTFVGSVRDVSEGKTVRYLEYEAYEPMALERLQQVVDEATDRWPVQAMAIQHRLGKLAAETNFARNFVRNQARLHMTANSFG